MLARCRRCEQMYLLSNEDPQACHYHSGRYLGSWWTCCRERGIGAQGCKRAAHVEDLAATALLDAVSLIGDSRPACTAPVSLEIHVADSEAGVKTPLVIVGPEGVMHMAESELDHPRDVTPCEETPASRAGELSTTPSVAVATVDGAAKGSVPPEELMLVPYLVGPQDTFSAICLRHSMQPHDLMHANGLQRAHASPGSTLLVWSMSSRGAQQEDTRQRLGRQFRRKNHCTASEALYYLEENDYDVAAAQQQRDADLAWECAQQGTASATASATTPVELEEATTALGTSTRTASLVEKVPVRKCLQCLVIDT